MLTQSSVSMFDPRAWKRTTQRYFLWLCTLRLVYDDVLAPQAPCAFFIMLLSMHLFEVQSAFKEKTTEYWIDFLFLAPRLLPMPEFLVAVFMIVSFSFIGHWPVESVARNLFWRIARSEGLLSPVSSPL